MDDEFKQRFRAAKSARGEGIETEGYEVYKFCFNGREDEWSGKSGRYREPEEVFADIVAGVAEDFTGDLFHTLTPENTDWVAYEAGVAVSEDDEQAVKDAIAGRERIIAKSLKSSNYYDEGPTAFQDAAFGTVAMWVDRPTFSSPITFEAVPCSELYLRLGPRGIEDRFRCGKYFYSDLEQLLPGATFPREIRDAMRGAGQAKVTWGFWRDYSDPDSPVWKQAVRVDDKEVGLDKTLGAEGSCPLLVGRFNAVPKSPWGRGPARRMLPTLRVLDELVRMNLEAMDHRLDPAIVYPHDGILDFSDGIEAGIAYPAMPGSADSIREILGGELDYGFFTEERIEERIRDGFYRDLPQKGKTPPSASQYMGEEQKQVRRMARPAGKLWKELGVGILVRTEWLESQAGGALEGVEPVLSEGRVVSIRPISPLERAQARDEVVTAQGIMAMAQESLGPQQAMLVIDGVRTMNNVKAALKDKLVEFRDEKQLQQAAELFMMNQGGTGEPQQ